MKCTVTACKFFLQKISCCGTILHAVFNYKSIYAGNVKPRLDVNG